MVVKDGPAGSAVRQAGGSEAGRHTARRDVMATIKRPVPRIGDHLDELLDLLDRARAEQLARLRSFSPPAAPHLALARAIVEPQRLDRAS
jgi:hypothetical protein